MSSEELDSNGNPIGDRDKGRYSEEAGKTIRLADGSQKDISLDRLDRIEHIGRQLTRGKTLREITDNLEENGYEPISYRQVQNDAHILREMKSGEIRNQLFFETISDMKRTADEAVRELWQVVEDEHKKPKTSTTNHDGDKEETSNSFARIKAVKQAFGIKKDLVKTFNKIGMDAKRAEFMEAQQGDDVSEKDISDIDDEIKSLMDSEKEDDE